MYEQVPNVDNSQQLQDALAQAKQAGSPHVQSNNLAGDTHTMIPMTVSRADVSGEPGTVAIVVHEGSVTDNYHDNLTIESKNTSFKHHRATRAPLEKLSVVTYKTSESRDMDYKGKTPQILDARLPGKEMQVDRKVFTGNGDEFIEGAVTKLTGERMVKANEVLKRRAAKHLTTQFFEVSDTDKPADSK